MKSKADTQRKAQNVFQYDGKTNTQSKNHGNGGLGGHKQPNGGLKSGEHNYGKVSSTVQRNWKADCGDKLYLRQSDGECDHKQGEHHHDTNCKHSATDSQLVDNLEFKPVSDPKTPKARLNHVMFENNSKTNTIKDTSSVSNQQITRIILLDNTFIDSQAES